MSAADEPLNEEEIFQNAAALPVAERAAYLHSACAGHPEMMASVERLLASIEDGGFMGKPLERTTSPEMEAEFGRLKPEEAGDVIGHYKLLQQIGEGGFGIVWMAEQEKPVRRRVALKIIKLGMNTKEVIARFEQERQALAIMEHPNIARVLDAGATQWGRPYFAMELVRGVKITEYCDKANLSTKDRLRLFIAVCNAVQHAHQKGIIHRDLKPSNILVTLHDGVPVPKVIDFGVAKAIQQQRLTDLTLFTQFEQMVGTPLYMSPEQAELSGLDIDTRSDIYSLGVLLYELLTGRTPFDPEALMRAGLDEIRRVIREEEPQKPSTFVSTMAVDLRTNVAQHRQADSSKLVGQIRGDLDWIVMKALEKDRNRRYDTANGLAKDIERHLQSEPVQARPPSTRYKLSRFARRNKGAVAAGGTIAAVFVVATIVSSWSAIRAGKAEKLASDRLVESDRRGTEAQAIATLLTDVFQSPDPARDGRTVTVAETLDGAVKKIDTDLTTQPGRRALLQGTLGRTYLGLGLYPSAIPLLEQSRAYYLQRFGLEHPDTLQAMFHLAQGYSEVGQFNEARTLMESVVEHLRKLLGPKAPFTLEAMWDLVGYYHTAGRTQEALKLGEEALALSQAVFGQEDSRLCKIMSILAECYSSVGRLKEALKLREDALDFSRKSHGPEHVKVAGPMTSLVSAYIQAHRLDEALELAKQALTLHEKIYGPTHGATLSSMSALAEVHHAAGRKEEAIKLEEKALQIRRIYAPEHPATLMAMLNLAKTCPDAEQVLALHRKVFGPEHPDTSGAMQKLGVLYAGAGRSEEAIQVTEKTLELRRKVLGSEHPKTLDSMFKLADFYSKAQRMEEAVKLEEQVLAIREKAFGPGHHGTIDAMYNLAAFYNKAGRVDKAVTLSERAVALSRERVGDDHPDTLGIMHNLVTYYDSVKRADEAVPLGEQVLEMEQRILGPEHPVTIKAMVNLGSAYRAVGRTAEGLKLLERAFELNQKVLGREHPGTLNIMHIMARHYNSVARTPEALELAEEVLRVRRKVLGPEHHDTIAIMDDLSALYHSSQRTAEAVNLAEQVVELSRKVYGPEHLLTIEAMRDLAHCYGSVQRTDDALKVAEEVLALRKKVLGLEHPDTLLTMTRLANAYHTAKRLEAAMKLGQELLGLKRKMHGPEHPETLSTMSTVAGYLDSAGQKGDALKLRAEMEAAEERAATALPPLDQITLKELPILRSRARQLARKGQWKEAVADLETILKLDSADYLDSSQLAPLLLQVGAVERYREHCQHILEKFRATASLRTMSRLAEAGLLLPGEEAQLAAASKLADAAVAQGPEHPFRASFRVTKGLAQYRRSQFKDAISTERTALADSVSPPRAAQAYAVIAMAHKRLKQSGEARAALAKASELAATPPPEPEADVWHTVLIANILLREAQALLGEK